MMFVNVLTGEELKVQNVSNQQAAQQAARGLAGGLLGGASGPGPLGGLVYGCGGEPPLYGGNASNEVNALRQEIVQLRELKTKLEIENTRLTRELIAATAHNDAFTAAIEAPVVAPVVATADGTESDRAFWDILRAAATC